MTDIRNLVVRCPKDLYKQLKIAAAENDKSLQVIMIEIIKEYLANKKDKC